MLVGEGHIYDACDSSKSLEVLSRGRGLNVYVCHLRGSGVEHHVLGTRLHAPCSRRVFRAARTRDEYCIGK